MPNSDRLLPPLRSALRHLYDSAALRSSPLIAVLGLADSPDPASELRQVLTRTIRSLQPEAGMPAHTEVWRVYEILLYRYVQRCSQLEVAEQLGLSVRHLGREERKALQILTDRLRQQLDARPPGAQAAGTPSGAGPDRDEACPINDEVAWLGSSALEEAVDLEQVLPSVLELVQPMAQQHGVTLQVESCPGPVPLAVHPVALRQILLSLLSLAIRRSGGREVCVLIRPQGWNVRVQVRPLQPYDAGKDSESVAASLGMAGRLAETCGGSLSLEPVDGCGVATISLPALEQLPVLVIDDNANTLRLLQRYVTSTRYRLVGAETLQDGLALAQDLAPRIIVLDVMMPDMDGWEALGRLRQHPLTSQTPVIVCTILAEEELALSLGASAFVRKPVSREAFLSALDRQAGPAAPGSC